MVQPKFNPFRPNGMVQPGMFVGRVDELDVIEQCLLQGKHNNPQHFLLTGERGIGKSSLLFYVNSLAKGRIRSSGGQKFNFLCVSIDLANCVSQLDVIQTIARGLRDSLSDYQQGVEAARALLGFLKNWEVLGVRYHGEERDPNTAEATDQLVKELASFSEKTVGTCDGILILIDEADRPSADAGLGELLKLLTERLARRACNNVILGLAGLPLILGRLKESHESSPRLFEIMNLKPLEPEERKTVVRICLDDSRKANSPEVSITSEALEFLAELSEGYPHFVQQFGYSAFAQDSDNIIDVEDVGDGAYKEGGALSQLGDKFFNDMYHARISSEEYRRVLDAMAEHSDEWVARKDIIIESGKSEASVTNALATLKAKNIIVQDDTRRGFYRLPTKSFAAWINAIRAAREKASEGQQELF